MKMTGLKGVTDAMGHCKSMYGAGGSAGTNQMIRSMKSYAVGGSTDDSCMEEYMGADGKRRRRRKSGCGKVTKYGKRGVSDGVKKAGAAVLAGGAAMIANKKYGLVDKAKQALGMKKGGTVKRTAKKK
jgi:hypothetical protein